MARINVMQLTDTLDAGGAERVAVNIANLLPRERYKSWLCTTRHEGTLATLLDGDVGRLALNRKSRYHLQPVNLLLDTIDRHDIRILHAHSSALFVGLVAAFLRPRLSVIWHIHHPYHASELSPWHYRIAVRRVAAVLAVSQQVADWACERVWLSPARVSYLPNFSPTSAREHDGTFQMPGLPGQRVTCVANIRPQKDHHTLLAAFERVLRSVPDAHLLLVGGASDPDYRAGVAERIHRQGLDTHVSLLGERTNVGQILAQSDVAVLSSATEGFPLALLEYGQAGLPVVATRVGQCADVLRNGAAGLLVEPGNVDELATALVVLLKSADDRRRLGETLQRTVRERYGVDAILRQVCGVYERIVGSS